MGTLGVVALGVKIENKQVVCDASTKLGIIRFSNCCGRAGASLLEDIPKDRLPRSPLPAHAGTSGKHLYLVLSSFQQLANRTGIEQLSPCKALIISSSRMTGRSYHLELGWSLPQRITCYSASLVKRPLFMISL